MNIRERFMARYFGSNGLMPALQLCVYKDHTATALGLICAAIESMAFLSLPDDCDSVCDHDFVSWAKKYLEPHKLGISPFELWTVRCQLLEGQFAPGSKPEDDKSREVLFAWGKYAVHEGARLRAGSRWHQVMSIRAEELLKALLIGTERFVKEYIAKPDNEYSVNRRLNTVFGNQKAEKD